MSKLDEGKYRGRICEWSLSQSKTKKTPQFAVTCELIGYYDRDQLNDMSGSDKRTVFKFITENTVDYFIEDMRKLGWNGDQFAELNPDHPGGHNFKDVEVDLTCEHETYEGKDRERWNFAFGGGGMQLTALDKKGVSSLQALFGSKLKATAAKPAAKPMPAKPVPAPAAATADEDTIETL